MAFALCLPSRGLEAPTLCAAEAGSVKEPGSTSTDTSPGLSIPRLLFK